MPRHVERRGGGRTEQGGVGHHEVELDGDGVGRLLAGEALDEGVRHDLATVSRTPGGV